MTVATLMREAASGLGGIASIVPTLLTAGGSSTAGTTFNTASISVAAGETVLLQVAATAGATIGTCTPTLAGVTFIPIVASDPAQPRGFAIFRGTGSGSGAVQLVWSVSNGSCNWVIGKATGFDATTPVVHYQLLNSAANANAVTIYARKFRDATNNASFLFGMCGRTTDDLAEGSGYTKLGSTVAGAANGLIMAYQIGEDLTADFSWGGTAVSNLGAVVEFRAAGSAALPTLSFVDIIKGGSTAGATTYTGTTHLGGVPVYASAHPIYFGVYNTRSGSTITVPTVTGGGVTWVQIATLSFNTNQDCLTVFRAMGPLNGTDISVAVTTSHTGCQGWMVADPGADLTGTNGSGSVVQFKAASASATAVASATFDAAPDAANGVIGFFAESSQGGGVGFRTAPGHGLITPSLVQNATLDPITGSPNQRMFVAAMPYASSIVDCTFGASGETAAIGIEVKAA